LARGVFRRCAALDCPKVNLQVITSNATVVPLYERLGYLVEPRISMGKTLTDGSALKTS
jgi:hypothetical protein